MRRRAFITLLGAMALIFKRASASRTSAEWNDDDFYRVPEIVTRGRFPDGGESDSTWRTQEARHVGSDTIAPGF